MARLGGQTQGKQQTMTWFEDLTGFAETTPDQVRAKLRLEDTTLTSLVNGNKLVCGRLQMPSLAELRTAVQAADGPTGNLSVRETVADVQALHAEKANAGALFQVASQFNLLEMTSPRMTPEHGVGRYEQDPTQGPACAIAAGAGTIYRNYFVWVDNKQGQSKDRQIDCLAELGQALGNAHNRLWHMQNGYALASREGLIEITKHLRMATDEERDALRALLRIGLQWQTQVTLQGCDHLLSQAYCSALPVAYTEHPPELWEPFARPVLEAAYEAMLCAALWNRFRHGQNRAFLTLLGGGVFGNENDWIMQSLLRALLIYRHWDLDIAIVSHRRSNPDVLHLLDRFQQATSPVGG